MDIVTLAQATEQTVRGYGAIGYGLAAIGPGIGIGILVGKTVEGMRPAYHDVPRYRLHRGARPDRYRRRLPVLIDGHRPRRDAP